jgi:hypothetical protein
MRSLFAFVGSKRMVEPAKEAADDYRGVGHIVES